MRVLVAGGAGAIGRPLLPRLVEAGHHVVATTRSEARAARIREVGGVPAVVNAFDSGALRRVVLEAGPDVVVHQLTALSAPADDYASWLAATNRLRGEVTGVLVEAARDAGARRVVAQSASFMTAPRGPEVLDEDAPLYLDAPEPILGHVKANAALEQAVTGTDGVEGVVLRYGFFYGPGTGYAPGQPVVEAVRSGRTSIVGDGAGRWPFIHIDDAAEATAVAVAVAVAVDRGVPGIYNVVDDDPALMRDWLPHLAALLGGPPPGAVAVDEAARMQGVQAVYYGT